MPKGLSDKKLASGREVEDKSSSLPQNLDEDGESNILGCVRSLSSGNICDSESLHTERTGGQRNELPNGVCNNYVSDIQDVQFEDDRSVAEMVLFNDNVGFESQSLLEIDPSIVDGGDCKMKIKKDLNSTINLPKTFPKLKERFTVNMPPGEVDIDIFNSDMLNIYTRVFQTAKYNFQDARIRVTSGLHVDAWESYLKDYHDSEILQYLKFGWPSNFLHASTLVSTYKNHKSAVVFSDHIDSYISTEMGKYALLGPFAELPVIPLHLSPIMTRIVC